MRPGALICSFVNPPEPHTPSSPAGAPARVDPSVPALPSVPRPKAGDLTGAVLTGLPAVLFTSIAAAAVALVFVGPAAQPIHPIATAIFVVIPSVGLAVFARRWVITLRELARGADVRWPFLLVPFFIVVGVACGVAFAFAATHRVEPVAPPADRT